ncbi:PilN domain-containing protein [Lysinibacillus sp. 38-6]|uniref:PilN domain-containing protein n=1 Tax=Lysinibacillus sp. 38-6 TaxID=3385991 RepID=UPI003908A0AA
MMVPEINLLPNLEKQKSAPILVYIGIIALVGIVIAYMIFLYFQARGEIKQLNAQEIELTSKQTQLQIELDGIRNMNAGTLEQSVQFVNHVSYPVTPLIDETQALLPEHTYLRNYQFGEENIEITADFETMSAISNYLDKLNVSPYFTDVQVGTIENFDLAIGEQNEVNAQDKYQQLPRYSVTISLAIDFIFLVGGSES